MALKIVIIGLSLSSSWGNGHATTYRSLVAGLSELGHQVQFLERDVPWYASHRDLPNPEFCRLEYYSSVDALKERFTETIRSADLVIIGSYVPEGVAIIDAVASLSPRTLCFYDIDTPITMAKLDRGEEEYIAPRQMPLFDTTTHFPEGRC
jgi:spore maturation protein CgeB